jgi:hypothetical protein
MEEELINHLYNVAGSEGFTGSRENFIQLLNTDDEVVNYLHSQAKKEGYTGDIVNFTNLVRGPKPPLVKTTGSQSQAQTENVDKDNVGTGASKFATGQEITPNAESKNMTSLTEDVYNTADNIAAKDKFSKISNEEMPTKKATSMSTVADVSKQEQYETNRLRVKNNERDNSISTGQEITPSSESSNMTSLTEKVNNANNYNSEVNKELANSSANFSKLDKIKGANSLSIIKNAEGKPDLKLTISESINKAFPEGTKVDAVTVKEKLNDILTQTIENKLLPVNEGTQIKAVETPEQKGATVKVASDPQDKLEKYLKEKLASEKREDGFVEPAGTGTYEKYFADYYGNVNDKGEKKYEDQAYSGKFKKYPIGNILQDFLSKSDSEIKVPTVAFRDTEIDGKLYRKGDKLPTESEQVKDANYYGMQNIPMYDIEDLTFSLSNIKDQPFDRVFTYTGATPSNTKEFKTFKAMDGSTLLYHPKSKTILKENKNAPDWKLFSETDVVSGRTKEELANTKTWTEVIDNAEYNKLKKYIK